jgi:hypothetical protein
MKREMLIVVSILVIFIVGGCSTNNANNEQQSTEESAKSTVWYTPVSQYFDWYEDGDEDGNGYRWLVERTYTFTDEESRKEIVESLDCPYIESDCNIRVDISDEFYSDNIEAYKNGDWGSIIDYCRKENNLGFHSSEGEDMFYSPVKDFFQSSEKIDVTVKKGDEDVSEEFYRDNVEAYEKGDWDSVLTYIYDNKLGFVRQYQFG